MTTKRTEIKDSSYFIEDPIINAVPRPITLELTEATLQRLEDMLRRVLDEAITRLIGEVPRQLKVEAPPKAVEAPVSHVAPPEASPASQLVVLSEEQPKEVPIMRRRGSITEVVRGGVWTRIE